MPVAAPKPEPRAKRKPKGLKRTSALKARNPMGRGTKKLQRSKKRIAARRARFAGTGHWEKVRAEVHARQDGRCCRCGREVLLHGMPVMVGSHVEPLRFGGCRDNPDNWRNDPENVAGLCVACDRFFDALPVAARVKWMNAWLVRGTWRPSDVLPGHGSRRSS